jgi:DNA repair exonuclease SbcCD nuclease subunit
MSIDFSKIVAFTDIHFGEKGNEQQHNIDCYNFVKWACEEAQQFGAKTCVFLGDWHHNRHTVAVNSLHWSHRTMELLDSSFDDVIFILGNHDLYYKDKRDIHSAVFARNFKNFHVIDEIRNIDGVGFVPWLIGDEWKRMPKFSSNCDYIFGHFELPHFYMNAQVMMSDHGQLNHTHFDSVKHLVFSGHFHKRQVKGKVWYIGNTFPHNFSDAWDDERGIMLLNYGNKPQFKTWEHAPQYRTLNLSELLEDSDSWITCNTYAKINIDVPINFDEAQLIKDIFLKHTNAIKIDIIPNGKNHEGIPEEVSSKFMSVDEIVTKGLMSIDSISLDPKLLVDIYKELI